jgi:hypothetical protein
VSSYSSVLFLDKSQRASGKLGIDKNKSADDERQGNNIVVLRSRDIVYGKRKPGKIEVGIANVKIAKRMAAIEGVREITEKNAQELLEKREAESLKVLRAMGFDCFLATEKEKKFNLDAMRRQWIIIREARYEVEGEISGVDEVTRTLMTMTIEGRNDDLAACDFDRVVDDIAGNRLSYDFAN